MFGFRRVTLLVIALACWLVLIHMAEIAVWGLFYFWQGCLPDLGSALFYSAGAYTTIGSGLALPEQWRMFAPLEALTGALMFGLSTGLFFVVVSRWIHKWMQNQTLLEPNSRPHEQVTRLPLLITESRDRCVDAIQPFRMNARSPFFIARRSWAS